MVNIMEPPSSKKWGLKSKNFSKSAHSALAGFGTFLLNIPEYLESFRLQIRKLIFIIEGSLRLVRNFLVQKGANRSLAYKFLIVAAIALLPVVSKVTAEEQAYTDVIHYSQTIDPVESARFAVYFSGYTPGMYVDADQVALAAVTSNDSYTLEQQLAVNQGKDYAVDGRQDPTYEVKGGETITQVAKKFNLHVGSIVDANNLSATELKNIKPGTVLVIPSSDTNTSDDWLVAINKADADAKQAAIDAANKKAAQAKVAAAKKTTTNVIASSVKRVSSEVTIIGTSFEQCVVWARENSGIQIHGYAGDIAPTQSDPQVGGIALDRFYGHASVVVSVGSDYIIVHEANWVRGKITERKVSKDAIRGYVY